MDDASDPVASSDSEGFEVGHFGWERLSGAALDNPPIHRSMIEFILGIRNAVFWQGRDPGPLILQCLCAHELAFSS